MNNFATPCLVSFAVAGLAGHWLVEVSGKQVLFSGYISVASWLACGVISV